MKERRDNLVAAHLPQRDVHDLRKGGPVEDVRDGVSDIEHQHTQPTVVFVRAGAASIRSLAHARDRRERPIDEANDVAHANAVHRLADEVSAMLPPLGLNVTGGSQLGKNLLEELDGEPLLFDKLGCLQERALELLGDAEIDQGSQGIFTTF